MSNLENAMLELYMPWAFRVSESSLTVYVMLGADVDTLKKDLEDRGFHNVKIIQVPCSFFGLYK